MRKTLLFLSTLLLTAAWLIGCGDNGKKITTTTTTPSTVGNIAFMQEAGSYLFTPQVGKFTLTGNTLSFTASGVVDPTTNQPVAAEFFSIALSSDAKQAALEIYGGLDGTDGQWDIFVAKSDGTGTPVQITNDANDNRMPQFSPDGSKVIFTSLRTMEDGYQHELVVTRTVSGGVETVYALPLTAFHTYAPTYSPDGRKIAVEAWGYDANSTYFDGIVVMNSDGTNAQLITNPTADTDSYDETPSFSADGTKIAFSRDTYDSTTSVEYEDIYIMNSDGTGLTKLTNSSAVSFDPLMVNLTGVGQKILFSSNKDNLSAVGSSGFEIYMMNTDGTGVTRLTTNSLYDSFSGSWYAGTDVAAARRAKRNIHVARPSHIGHNHGHVVSW